MWKSDHHPKNVTTKTPGVLGWPRKMQFNSFWNLFFGVFFLVNLGFLCFVDVLVIQIALQEDSSTLTNFANLSVEITNSGCVFSSTRDAGNSGHQKIVSIFSRIPIETFMSLHFQ